MSQISLPVMLAICLMATVAILANMISFIMIGKINVLRPEHERISYLCWGTGIRKQFKQLYPGNKLVILLDACLVMTILCFIFLVKFWVFSNPAGAKPGTTQNLPLPVAPVLWPDYKT